MLSKRATIGFGAFGRSAEGDYGELAGRSIVLGGTSQDELRPPAELQKEGQYSAKYLALRARQGSVPA